MGDNFISGLAKPIRLEAEELKLPGERTNNASYDFKGINELYLSILFSDP